MLLQKLPGPVRGRPFEKGRSGNPAGRRPGSRNKATLAAAALLAGESEALTRTAVELALAGDPTAMRLCIGRLLRPCRERTVKLTLPPIESVSDIADAMRTMSSGHWVGITFQLMRVILLHISRRCSDDLESVQFLIVTRSSTCLRRG